MKGRLPAVRFVPARRREKAIIGIAFAYDEVLIRRVKALPGAAWSQTMRCWYVPDTEADRTRFEMGAKTAPAAMLLGLCAEKEAALSLFVKELQLKGYSRRTMVTYRNGLRNCCKRRGGCR